MSILDSLFGNKSMQDMLLTKFKGIMSKQGFDRVILDMTGKEMKIEELKPDMKIISETEYLFLINFYNNNKEKL